MDLTSFTRLDPSAGRSFDGALARVAPVARPVAEKRGLRTRHLAAEPSRGWF